MNREQLKSFGLTLGAALFALSLAATAAAQCAMCKASASSLGEASARNLNYAILLLLCPPVAIFCGLFVVAYKRREPPQDDGDSQ